MMRSTAAPVHRAIGFGRAQRPTAFCAPIRRAIGFGCDSQAPRIQNHLSSGGIRRGMWPVGLLLAILMLAMLTGLGQAAGRFALADPVWEVNDTLEIPEPESRGWNRYQYFIDCYWRRPLDDVLSLKTHAPAADINSMDDVPASCWFTPRNGRRPLSEHAVERGNTTYPHLDRSEPLRVVAARIDGPEPFLELVEGSGRSCILELDDPSFPEMRTAAAVIAGRLLYAAGYEVLECFIDRIHPNDLILAPKAKKIGEFGGGGDLNEADLEKLFAKLDAGSEALRVAVSRLPEGTPKGGFPDKGTRRNDPNDRIPHQDRRSLRGLRILASWIEHTRMRPDRTLDVYLQPQHYMRHYLTGLGISLGAQVLAPHAFGTEGRESYWQMGSWMGNLLALGFGKQYDETPAAPSPFRGVGALDSRGFEPLAWEPAYGFEPFRRMDWADALWGARLVASFTDEQIRAAVRPGGLSDQDAENYVAGTLVERRDKIARAWFTSLNAADRFRFIHPSERRWTLVFEDLGISSGVTHPEDVQYVMTFTLPGLDQTLGQQSRGGHHLGFDFSPFLPSPWLHRSDPRRYGCAALRSYDYGGRLLHGETRVHVYFDSERGPRVIGIERD